MQKVIEKLWELSDSKYASFQSRLTPGIAPDLFIGVRVPTLRKFAKSFKDDVSCDAFLNELPHKYYDENMLHALLISTMKDYEQIIEELEKFLPYVDNWAVCDIMSPKSLRHNKEKLLKQIIIWTKSKHTHTCRFGIEMLMSFYLDQDFEEEYLNIPLSTRLDDYYVRMMVAWFFATALAKKWSASIKYIESNALDVWTHNKTIQKCIESYRISKEHKAYLRKLKRQ